MEASVGHSATIDGDRIKLCLGNYVGTIKVDELPRWLRFYRKMRDREGGKYAKHYQPTVDVLEQAARDLEKGLPE